MSKQSRQAERLDAIRSVSIEDIVYGRHTRWRRLVRRAKPALAVASVLGLTAAACGAVYYTLSGPAESPLGESLRAAAPVVAAASEPAHTGSLPAAEAPPPAIAEAAALAALEPFAAARVEPLAPTALRPPSADTPEPEDLARVPMPRPDEPVITGSIPRPASAAPQVVPERAAEERRFQPCRTLQKLTARLPFPRVSCVSDRRFGPPRHARYVPGPPYAK